MSHLLLALAFVRSRRIARAGPRRPDVGATVPILTARLANQDDSRLSTLPSRHCNGSRGVGGRFGTVGGGADAKRALSASRHRANAGGGGIAHTGPLTPRTKPRQATLARCMLAPAQGKGTAPMRRITVTLFGTACRLRPRTQHRSAGARPDQPSRRHPRRHAGDDRPRTPCAITGAGNDPPRKARRA